ncbi:hypothetical protein A8C56_06855 [Niabella ginsenosidivorans]|uniref:Uncharacterized protein n=1 Tax=Niabella ginsenosidivorans TaxID=1176587 RepID=A0A1A9I2D3_9BACT|nr:hypothetical protein A8C56_06855 [Niabella ginsenosidivorans]
MSSFPFVKIKSSESSDEAMIILLTGYPEDVIPNLFRDLFLFQGLLSDTIQRCCHPGGNSA